MVRPFKALACTAVVGIPRVAGVVADSFESLSSRDHFHILLPFQSHLKMSHLMSLKFVLPVLVKSF